MSDAPGTRFDYDGTRACETIQSSDKSAIEPPTFVNRSAGTLYRDDEFLDLCGALVNERGRPPLLTTVALECGVDAALSWHLPKYEVDEIRKYFQKDAEGKLHPQVREQVEKLKLWFGDGGGTELRKLPRRKS